MNQKYQHTVQTFVSVVLDWQLADKSEVPVDSSQTHDRVVVESYCTLRFLVIWTTIGNHVSTAQAHTQCHGNEHKQINPYHSGTTVQSLWQCT